MHGLLQKLFATLHDFMERQAKFRKFKARLKEGTLEIGPHTYGIPEILVFRGSEAKVRIGAFCSLAPGIIFITGGVHPSHWVST